MSLEGSAGSIKVDGELSLDEIVDIIMNDCYQLNHSSKHSEIRTYIELWERLRDRYEDR